MIKIIAIDSKGNTEEITDWLYWFEENGVRDFGGQGHNDKYAFQIFIDGEKIWESEEDGRLVKRME